MVLLVAYKCSKIVFAVPSVEINAMTIGARKVGKQKQKWITEEEEALSAGVAKYGLGKWKLILTDPQFAPSLVNRSNIDLKDKWRNMTVSGAGSSSRERVRTPVLGIDLNLPVCSPEPSTVLPLVVYDGTPEPSRSTVDRRTAPDYEAMVFEALSTLEDPNGLDLTAILNFIEERYELPQNFRRSVSSKLRRLVLTGELEKVGNRYKYKTPEQEDQDVIPMNVENTNEDSDPVRPLIKSYRVGNRYKYKTSEQEDQDVIPMNVENTNEEENEEDEISQETPEDAANVLAYKIAKAENMEQAAIDACKETEKLAKLLEESIVMLQIAEDIHERCLRDGFVLLNH